MTRKLKSINQLQKGAKKGDLIRVLFKDGEEVSGYLAILKEEEYMEQKQIKVTLATRPNTNRCSTDGFSYDPSKDDGGGWPGYEGFEILRKGRSF